MSMAGGLVKPETADVGDGTPSDSPELHVLAVDDSLVDRKVVERLLKISSCKVTAVESGPRALEYLGIDGERRSVGFKGLKVNLIMTDYSMPGMTGYELLKRVKESSALKEIPVVIMSSENILPRIDRCLEEGAEDFLLKPIKLSDVKRLKEFVMKCEAEEIRDRSLRKRKLETNTDPLQEQSQLSDELSSEELSSAFSDELSSEEPLSDQVSSEETSSPLSDQPSFEESPSPLSDQPFEETPSPPYDHPSLQEPTQAQGIPDDGLVETDV